MVMLSFSGLAAWCLVSSLIGAGLALWFRSKIEKVLKDFGL